MLYIPVLVWRRKRGRSGFRREEAQVFERSEFLRFRRKPVAFHFDIKKQNYH